MTLHLLMHALLNIEFKEPDTWDWTIATSSMGRSPRGFAATQHIFEMQLLHIS